MIIRKYGAELEREENVGENQNCDCSVFARAFIGRSYPFQAEAFSQIYNHRQDLYICITLTNSGDLAKDTEEQEKTAYVYDQF